MTYIEELHKSIARHKQHVESILKTNGQLDVDDMMALLLERDYFVHIAALSQNRDPAIFATTQLIDQRLRTSYQSMKEETMRTMLRDVDMIHGHDFLYGFILYEGYRSLSQKGLQNLLLDHTLTLRQLLGYEELVAYYDQTLSTYITAHVRELLDVMMDHDDYQLPASLTSVAFNEALLKYLRRHHIKEKEAAFLSKLVTIKGRLIYNDVRLIASYKLLDGLRGSLPEGYLSGKDMHYTFKKQKEERLTTIRDDHLEISYSLNAITKHYDYASLMNHFLYMFDYCDYQGRLKSGRVFHIIYQAKDDLNNMLHGFADEMFDDYLEGRCRQLMAYDDLLRAYNSSLHHLVTWFFNRYLPHFFKQGQLRYHTPDVPAEQTYALFKQFQKVLKVYEQERTLFHIDQKYAYGNKEHELYQRIVYLLFDEQSLINKTHYASFYDALLHHAVVLDKYHDIEMSYISDLVRMGLVAIRDGVLSITEEAKCLKELHDEGVIVRIDDFYSFQCIALLKKRGLLRYGHSFLSDDELGAWTYIMKKALSSQHDDWMLMFMMVECMIKINDELSHYGGGDYE